MRTFLILWLGQLVSVFGSALTGFALGVWIYERTGSATLFALISFANTLPRIASLPFAGAMVDRWDRRTLMIVSHLGSGASSAALFFLSQLGEVWVGPLLLIVAISTSFATVQWPAMSAITPLLIEKEQLGRATGLLQMGPSGVLVVAPLLGGLLFQKIGLAGVIVLDLVTFACAVFSLAVIRIPQPPRRSVGDGEDSGSTLWQEAREGWNYLRAQKGLWALLMLFAATNFTLGTLQVLVGPLILGMATPVVYGEVLSIWSVGGLLGGLAMTVWGGPERKVRGIFLFLAFQGSILFLGGVRPSVALITGAGFLFLASQPLINGFSQVIWLRKVPLDLQGRVFAFRRMVAWSSLPLSQLLAGPLTEIVFEPLLAEGGPLASSVGAWIGVGPGRGIGFFFMLLGVSVLVAVALGSSYRPLRDVETEMPDAIQDGVDHDSSRNPD